MSDLYKCEICYPACFLFAPDDETPKACPFCKRETSAEWKQIG